MCCHRSPGSPKERFAFTTNIILMCVLTYASSQNLSCCHRHYQLIQTSIPHSRSRIGSCCCLSPVEFPSKLSLHYHKTPPCALCTILHIASCLLSCKLLTFSHPVLPPFYVSPTFHSTVACIPNCCVLFSIPCMFMCLCVC
jgi:hypothetical protein